MTSDAVLAHRIALPRRGGGWLSRILVTLLIAGCGSATTLSSAATVEPASTLTSAAAVSPSSGPSPAPSLASTPGPSLAPTFAPTASPSATPRIAATARPSPASTVAVATPTPTALIATGRAIGVSAGDYHTCALTRGGGVKCWGQNTDGQLGNGSTPDSATPVEASGLRRGVTAVVAGGDYTCALTSGGGVKCWGYNGSGQLGNGSTAGSPTPVDVVGLASGITAITVGDSTTCALTRDGGVKCWGRLLGNGSTTTNTKPVDISGLASGVTAIAAGYGHVCALMATGRVRCWGYNRYGQLGNGSTTNSAIPVDISGLTSGVTAIAAGAGHTCAITEEGGATCWGYGGDGQLGNGSTADSAMPVDVAGLTSGVTAIAAGILHSEDGSHTCAVTSAGSAMCWGPNTYGQLGNGSYTKSSVPVQVSGLASGVAAITVSNDHTCALTSGGGVACWGNNTSKQAGKPLKDSNVPVVVSGL